MMEMSEQDQDYPGYRASDQQSNASSAKKQKNRQEQRKKSTDSKVTGIQLFDMETNRARVPDTVPKDYNETKKTNDNINLDENIIRSSNKQYDLFSKSATGAAVAQDYYGQGFVENMKELNDQQKREQMTGKTDNMGTTKGSEDQFNKKQIEFKEGRVHQLITDQRENSNKIYANRYQGLIGIWYFFLDTTIHFENILAIFLLIMVMWSTEYNQIDYKFPMIAFCVNIGLMSIRNLSQEQRQRLVTNHINNKILKYLLITRKFKRFLPITWADVKPGYIIQLRSGQEFPADCLILDITGAAGQKCYVTAGPFDESTGIIQKRSYSNLQIKSRERTKQNEQYLEQLMSGVIKYEYNYFGYIQGSFKHNDSPTALEFDHDNVVHRGAFLTQTPMITALVLNVGDQCMGSVYKDPKQSLENDANFKIKSMVKTQRSFDKAYKHSIRLFLLGLALFYAIFAGIAVYLASNGSENSDSTSLFYVNEFEYHVMMLSSAGIGHYIIKSMGFFSILLSSIPLSFSNIIDLLVLCHTNFAEWDINIQQARIQFLYPHATLAFGKVAHMFFSRNALQGDDKIRVKVFHIGGHFFLNQKKMLNSQYLDVFGQNDGLSQGSDQENKNNNSENSDSSQNEDETIDYLPNELKFSKEYQNEDVQSILDGPVTKNKLLLTEFFRGITLCHQASIQKNFGSEENTYIGVFHDELASLDFVFQQQFKLVRRDKKMMTLNLQGQLEQYEELGVMTTKAVMGHFLTVGAVRLQGEQAGVLYMKGSIATLKHYFINRESDFKYLNHYEQKFIQSGVQAIVYAKRKLTIEETNQLIITINEGVTSNKINDKLDKMLYNLTSIQLEILGILGLQKAIHFRNRCTVDDMVLNGVKPWIVSKEDEISHLTSLNSLRLFQDCAAPLVINGQREQVVMDQIQNALKIVTDRKAGKLQMKDEIFDDNITNLNSNGTAANSRSKGSNSIKEKFNFNDDYKFNKQNSSKYDSRNIVIFTGKALVEIFRDQTMQKAFMTLAYISDLMVGSEISPIQKQRMIRVAKNYIGEGEYVAAILSTPEDQFMVNEADLAANFKQKGKSADFQAVVDVTIRDFSAISYLLFKHGNQIQMRLSKAAQAFFYRCLISFLILFTYMIQSGFSGSIPYTDLYFTVFMIFLAPAEILVYSIFYKDIGYDYLYRIYGHYKYNFCFSLVEIEFVLIDTGCAFFDWLCIYLPFEVFSLGAEISTNGLNTSKEAYNAYQVILMQVTFFMYLKNTNVQVIYSLTILFFMNLLGILLILDGDEGLIGLTMLFSCPLMMFKLLCQILLLVVRNFIVEVASKLVFKRYSSLNRFYSSVEEKLIYEEYEDPEQIFHISQFTPLFKKINSRIIQNTLKLINSNMMKVPKTEVMEQILDKINTSLDLDRRGIQQVAIGGSINKLTLQLNDLNKEAEYQESKNSREIIYVKRQMLVFIYTTLFFFIFGMLLSMSSDYTNIGIYYYISLSVFSIGVYFILPKTISFLSNFLLFYTMVVIFCYSIYTAQSESLQPTGLIFVLALVAGLNHSFIYITIMMIFTSVAMHMFFSFLTEDSLGELNTFAKSLNALIWVIVVILWSTYVYIQEFEKKTQFVNAHRRVRQFLKLKSILNILVPSLVRDKIRAGNKGFSFDEGETTIIQIDIVQFDQIVQYYSATELLQFLDSVYSVFDTLCDQFGIQKIETVGKTYLAVGGLKSAEKKIDSRLLNRHHSVRTTDFAIEAINYVKSIFLKNGDHIQIRIGIHTGSITSSVIGDTKPQFTLLGPTLRKTSHIRKITKPNTVSISKETHHFLALYTNNYSFTSTKVNLPGFPNQIVYSTQEIKSRDQVQFQKQTIQRAIKNFDGQLIKEDPNEENLETNQYAKAHAHYDEYLSNEAEEEDVYYSSEHNESMQSNFKIHEKEVRDYQFEDKGDEESNKTEMIEDGSMNVFGFADDLTIDDRQIIKNASDNQIYNLVERPKYLLQFELKDTEREFLYNVSKAQAKNNLFYMLTLILINKIEILGDIMQQGQFESTPQFFIMFIIFILEIVLVVKMTNPTMEHIHFWNYMLQFYFVLEMGVLLSFQIKYTGKWTVAAYNELEIQLTLSLFFMMRNVMLRYFILTYLLYVIGWFIMVVLYYTKFEYQLLQFLLGQVMYVILLCVGIHHREMIQRKQNNYEKILNVEINKTNDLIQKLVPFHMLNVMKSEKRQVDEFQELTIMNAKIVGLENIHEPSAIVSLLQKIFTRFDQLCEENRVYKVHTFVDHYVVMGYTGRIDKNKRYRGIIIDEINRVISTGLEMLQIMNEFKEANKSNTTYRDLDIRVGISSGKVIAGIIGSKVVRYDIFGEGVYVANKVQLYAQNGKVCVSEDTIKILVSQPDIANEYTWEKCADVQLPGLNKTVDAFEIERKEPDSFDRNILSSENNDSMGSKYSRGSASKMEGHSIQMLHENEQMQSQEYKSNSSGESGEDNNEHTARHLKRTKSKQ